MIVTYADICDDKMLKLFKQEEINKIKQLEFGQDNLRVDLDAILEIMNLRKHSTFVRAVSDFDPSTQTVTFSVADSSGIRRSLLAQGIGKSIYYKINHQLNDACSNHFALEFAHRLIMPKKLIYLAMKRYRIMASKAQEDPDEFTLLNWDQLDVNRLLTYVAHTLGVTQTMLVYEMHNLNILERR